MGKKSGGDAAINLDSFLDIMTCLVGILVLIIILTGVDASQIKVLIPTPIENVESEANPIIIEARNNQLFLVPYNELVRLANGALEEISEKAQGKPEELLRLISKADVKTDIYSIDLAYALAGQIAVRPLQNSQGYSITDPNQETESTWFGRILAGMNYDEEVLTFLVRDDSFEVFQLARHIAWTQKAPVSYELLDQDEPITFGLQGRKSFSQ